MLALTDGFLARNGPGKRKCVVCGCEIGDPDDYLFIGYLGDQRTDPIGQFNSSTTLISINLTSRDGSLDVFLKLAKEMLSGRRWKGDALPLIVGELESKADLR